MGSAYTAYLAARIFDGDCLHLSSALLVNDSLVSGIVRREDIPESAEIVDVSADLLVPGFVDLQVNGGGGVMFGDDVSVEGLTAMVEAHASLGSTSILPTLISSEREVMSAAVTVVERALLRGVPGIMGIHFEGPHLAPQFRGVHQAEALRPLNSQDLDLLSDAAARLPRVMVTVAPDVVGSEQIKSLVDEGVVVSLGHTGASYEQCCRAVCAGAVSFTHLFNAMPPIESRFPGPVGAALRSSERSYIGLISDGIHVHDTNLRLVTDVVGIDRIYLVSDSMAVTGTELETFDLQGRSVDRRNGCLKIGERLAGADLDMLSAVRNMVKRCGIDVGAALKMGGANPSKMMGMDKDIGTLFQGARADFVALDQSLQMIGTWRGGQSLHNMPAAASIARNGVMP